MSCMRVPVDRLFEDRELFADYLTRYYTHFEPEALLPHGLPATAAQAVIPAVRQPCRGYEGAVPLLA
jgi:hypothetical protein